MSPSGVELRLLSPLFWTATTGSVTGQGALECALYLVGTFC